MGKIGSITKTVSLQTQGEIEIIDLTTHVERFISEAGLTNGIITLFVPGSTGAITTIEYEPGCINDLKRAIRMILPEKQGWQHDRIDNNAHSHLRAAFLGPSLSIPVENGSAVLGTWQQPVFIELDVRPRHRRIVLTAIGEFNE